VRYFDGDAWRQDYQAPVFVEERVGLEAESRDIVRLQIRSGNVGAVRAQEIGRGSPRLLHANDQRFDAFNLHRFI
jgi:hypothetical protein